MARLLALVAEGNEDGAALLALLKRDPGAVGLDSLLTEVNKLNDVRRLGLPEGLFADCSEKLVAAWRARAIKMYPSDFRDTAEDVRIPLLAALCSSRQAEITDALGDLLIALVQKINARAERRVERQITAEWKKVRGKEGILFRLADAAIGQPDKTVRTALYPVVGEKTLRDLVAEAKANEKVFKAKVRTTLRSSYSSYYRQMLPPLLRTLGFRCNNTAYRPVMDALALLGKYAGTDGKTRFYDAGDMVPMDGLVRKDWREAVVDDKGRIERIPYELCVLVALRDAIRRREIYIEGAARWRNPEDDLPGDFEATRTVHYAAIRQPLDSREFITGLKQRMTNGLDRLTAALADGSSGGVKVTTRHGEPWISVPKLEKLDERTGLTALKDEVVRRWGVLDLLDVLKNADFDTGFTDEFASVAAYERIDRAVLQRRLLLALFALGTNMGIRAIVATGEHGESEAALRHVRRHCITVDNLRAAVRKLVNATFAARDTAWWGQGTACASDSKKFGSWSSNFMTEYHARYGGNGVMIYWQCDLKAAHIEQATGRRYRRFRPVTNWSIPQSACGGSNPSVRSLAIRPKAEKTTGSVRVRGKSGRMNTSEPLTRTRKDHPPQWELSRRSRSYRVRTPARLRTPTVTAGVGHRGSRVREGIHPGRISRVWNRETPQRSLWVGRRQRRLNSSAGKGWSEKRMPPRRKARGKTG
ncbi:Tn3 family transposase [Streptomyces demainii]|uniref:Tn3 transposase DDE domain-containing protein n=1 Tax=Streptomyces demainii TaxID=588122 RepID=A0ABT9KWC6_9ACTN|nr:Tn3 family transposase [Streptomyces demainii]MDP9612749.1 hypothetical protein [Streptomyces demainii]